MMDFGVDFPQRDLVIAALSAMSVFCATIIVAWPYLARNRLDERMRGVAGEREGIRVRERSRLDTKGAPTAMRREPKKVFNDIVKRFASTERAMVSGTGRRLRMAGYRGTPSVVTFLAIRLIAPFVMFGSALMFQLFVLRLPQPIVQSVLIAGVAGAVGFFLPAIWVTNTITKRQKSILQAWPDALDLLLICVESGMAIEPALQKVSDEIGLQSIALAEELSLTTAELSFLQDRRQALENLSERTGLDAVKAVVASLKQAEKHGTSLGRSLRVLAQENRDRRVSLAEKKAAALPPKLTVPMILFFLPVLFAVIITPAVIQVMATH
jgi:tight adherence protein C